MSLPFSDPSLPDQANPYFQDNGFVRGDQARNNNALIWGNLDFVNFPNASVYTSLSAADKIAASQSDIVGSISLSNFQTVMRFQRYARISEQQPSGADAGTFNSGVWGTQTLNNIDYDPDNIISLSSSQITLGAGQYHLVAKCPAFNVNRHKAKLYNITDSIDVKIGSSEYSAAGGYAMTSSIIIADFTIAGTKTFEIQHQCSQSESVYGFGIASGFSSAETYGIVEIWKIGN